MAVVFLYFMKFTVLYEDFLDSTGFPQRLKEREMAMLGVGVYVDIHK